MIAAGDMSGEDRHFVYSTLRERIVEHVFVGDVLRTLWKRDVTDVEILRPEFDAHGYDVVMSRGDEVEESGSDEHAYQTKALASSLFPVV